MERSVIPGFESDLPVRRGDIGSIDVGDGAGSAVAHHKLQFALQNIDDAIDSCLTKSPKPPEERPAYADCFCAERERFEDVGAAAESSVDENGDAVTSLAHDFGKSFERRPERFGSAAAMIGYQDSVEAVVD